MPELEIITGAIAKIVYQNDSFVIARLKGGPSIKGMMFEPKLGIEYEFRGTTELHVRFGETFKFERYRALVPLSADALLAYLGTHASFVGPAIARRIIDEFGNTCLEVLKEHPERVAASIKGISITRANLISAELKDNAANEAVELDLRDSFKGVEISKAVFERIRKTYQSNAPAIVANDPYQLARDIDGVSFALADKIAAKHGIAKTHWKRIIAGVRHVLEEAAFSQGHIFLPKVEALGLARRLLDQPRVLIEETIVKSDTHCEFVLEGKEIGLRKLRDAEKTIAEKLIELLHAAPLIEAPEPNLDGLAEDQIEAVSLALKSNVFVLSGAAGSGKSTAIQHIIENFPASEVILCAPSGKAARRMQEVTGVPGWTIHALLGSHPVGNGFVFKNNKDNPLEQKVIVVDEVSLCDASLFASLLVATKLGTRLILIGDPYQLPSVGPGNVLGDLIASGVIPHVELKTIKRQDPGKIITNSIRVKDGIDIDTSNDTPEFEFVHAHSEDDVHEALLMAVERYSDKVSNPLLDLQVITALREKSEVSVRALNTILREHHHFFRGTGSVDSDFRRPFMIGDKVIQRKNDYQLEVMNGDVGIVRFVDMKQETITVEFKDPARAVVFKANNNALELGFCNTTHSMQGSAAQVVIIVCHPALGQLIPTRPWLYTSITRAIDHCVIIGHKEEISKIIRRNQSSNRWTNLKQLLKDKLERTVNHYTYANPNEVCADV